MLSPRGCTHATARLVTEPTYTCMYTPDKNLIPVVHRGPCMRWYKVPEVVPWQRRRYQGVATAITYCGSTVVAKCPSGGSMTMVTSGLRQNNCGSQTLSTLASRAGTRRTHSSNKCLVEEGYPCAPPSCNRSGEIRWRRRAYSLVVGMNDAAEVVSL